MRRYLPYWLLLVIGFSMTFSFMVSADEINNSGLPETLVDCEGVAIEYVDIDTCWPGEIISVPVIISNQDTLDKIELWGLCTGDVSYDDIDFSDTPWTGDTTDYSSGSTIEVHFTGGILDTSTTERRLIDVELQVSSSAAFGSTHELGYDHVVQVRVKGEEIDCDVPAGSLKESTISIPDDSVTVTLGWETAYSLQAEDAEHDPAKDDFPAIVPVHLYTNFPCSTYSLIFEVGDWGDYFGFESKGGGAACSSFTGTPDYIKIYGCPATKPGNDSSVYLGDIKMKMADFQSDYNSDCAFSDTFYFGFREDDGGARESFVYNWGGANPVSYADIDADTGGVILPPYNVVFRVKDADVQTDSTVEVPVTIEPSFYTQYFDIFVEFDTTYLEYDTVLSAGGTIPDVNGYVKTIEDVVWRTLEFEATEQTPQGKYALPDVEQTLFTIRFKAKDAFEVETTTDINVYDGSTYDSEVWDWFSLSGSKIKIDDGESCWTDSSGTVTHPTWFCLEPDPAITCYSLGTIAKIPIKLTYLNRLCGKIASITYEWSDYADSITSGDVAIDSIVKGPSSLGHYCHKIYFDVSFSEPGIFAYFWVSDRGGVDGDSFEIIYGSWVKCGLDNVYISPGDPIELDCPGGPGPKADFELPVAYSLNQNYPNPFNANTRISFSLAEPGFTEIEIFDVLGRKIKTLLSADLPAGTHSIIWNGTSQAGESVAGGVYFYVLRANEFGDSKKMMYLK